MPTLLQLDEGWKGRRCCSSRGQRPWWRRSSRVKEEGQRDLRAAALLQSGDKGPGGGAGRGAAGRGRRGGVSGGEGQGKNVGAREEKSLRLPGTRVWGDVGGNQASRCNLASMVSGGP